MIKFTESDTTESQTLTLTIEDAANADFDAQMPSDAIWSVGAEAAEGGEEPAAVVLDIDLNGFALNASDETGVLAEGIGSDGDTPQESEGDGERTGENGGDGGAGGVVTATIAGLTVDSTTKNNISLISTGGSGANGAKAESKNQKKATGGNGGEGGDGGQINAVVTNTTLTTGNGLSVTSIASDGGNGGEGKTSNAQADGGDGGKGGTGGTVNVVASDFSATGQGGIVASSRGGNGGIGGEAENGVFGNAYGGKGGAGGNGGFIDVTNTTESGSTGTLVLDVTSAPGLLAESVAGNGGMGGEGHSGGSGGDGGQGGAGGGVVVDISQADSGELATITTAGDNSSGLVARSYGGAGGDGGDGHGLGTGGGAGAGSGPGAGIDIEYTGEISTDGSLSDGIFAQSVGGFAGSAGDVTGIVAYGASSQSAGDGGGITLHYTGAGGSGIVTSGDDSDGVFVQSQGGGGGKASSTMALVALSGDEDGSSGGNGGALGITVSGTITTSGTRSRGVLAQSIGGTGGDGGSARGLTSIGGTGARGGSGGSISATSTADITTTGDDAIGILIQSIGGGGGSAGSTAGIAAIGGDGGTGATGGLINTTVGGSINTSGTGADGVVVQSIGGSGGHGSNTMALSAGFSVAIAGEGGSGGDGGEIQQLKTQTGSSITTQGDNARGIAAMSVGGGGGYGGNALSISANIGPSLGVSVGGAGGAGGSGKDVTFALNGSVATNGDNATAISALSVGGGGGSAGTTVSASGSATMGAVSLAVGGDGGGAGDGGAVKICRGVNDERADGTCASDGSDETGVTQTTGDGAMGLFASSIGGSGGQSGTTISGSVSSTESVGLAIGGNGGQGGNGAAVTVYSSGGITTQGAASGALVASSIGGSGGNANVVGSIGAVGEDGVNIGIGGDGGAAGASGAVYVSSTDTISTAGPMSAGIQATSQAGGGGSGSGVFSGEGLSSSSASISVGGAGGDGGQAGDVTVIWRGTSLTTGDEQSSGIFAMSGAGSGGNAGVTFSGSGAALGTADVSIGGDGGEGGAAGTASVTAGGEIQTTGFMSDGISAISQGGSGGRGGMSIVGSGVSQGSANVTIGGGGGIGGNAGEAMVNTDAGSSITTSGPMAAGINALSIGGNGGQGGSAIETGMNVAFDDEVPAGDATFVFGGGGAHGGTSARAYVHNSATILTQNFNSAGIQAQSIAGSGGSGGMAISGTINAGSSENIDVGLTFGGTGGAGGTAGEARVENVSDITTVGDNSSGILAQAIGGSGGAGGMTYNILSNFESGDSLNLGFDVAMGGGGGSGGTGGTASVNNGSKIVTSGTSSSGIYAQSIGGNGGSGGFGGTGVYNFGEDEPPSGNSSIKVNLSTTVGGEGGSGAVGGAVDVVNQGGGHITTSGSGAYGIFAQSVGGNGGDGGLSTNFSQDLYAGDLISVVNADGDGVSDADSGASSVSNTFTLKIGGNGGTGADAGTVTVSNDATLITTGDVAHGIVSQSVGGGGGVGGGAASNADSFASQTISSNTSGTTQHLRSLYNYTNLEDDFGSVQLTIGGEGGAAGDGEESSVTNSGTITTSGTNAYGIFSQSIGGGGGSGGEAASITDSYALQLGGDGDGGGNGGAVTVVNTGATITTAGYGSTAVIAQSIGGGGGNTGSKTGLGAIEDVTLAVGGKGGVAGDGGAVNVTFNSGSIATASEQASGIFAQSVGGGGGSHFGGIGTLSEDVTYHQNFVGGVESSSGDGGVVTVVSAANITTGPAEPGDLNAASIGIFAQSVGGGGGYSGSMILGDYEKIGASVRSSSSSASGNGGAVTVNQSGTIATTGDNSVGIFAQSVGGAGGVMGTLDKSSDDSSYVGSFGGEGVAGAVAVYAGGDIQTSGAGAHGIFAQYAGGTDSAGPVADETVIVQTSADVTATGAGAHAIHIENMGSGVGDVHIEIGGGVTINGGGQATYTNAQEGAGVYINSSQDSQLNNSGTIEAASGVAIYNLGDGTLTLTNNGTVNGSITGTNVPASAAASVVAADAQSSSSIEQTTSSIYVDNLASGVLNAGDTLDVARLRNWGHINVGQSETVSGTRITGDFEQNTGQVVFDVDMSSVETDMLIVDGQAELGGTLDVNVLSVSEHPNGAQSLKIIEAAGGLDVSELEVIPSVVARYALETASATELNLSYDVDYVNDALVRELNTNQRGLTSYFDSLYHAGELDEDLAKSLIGVTTTEDYASFLNLMGPELALANGVAGLSQTLGFADTLFSCPNQDQGSIWFDNGQCGYLTFSANRLDRDGTGGASGFSQDGTRINAGGQMLLDKGFAIGASLAYDSTSLTTDAGATSNGSTFSGGLSAKGFADRWEFGAAVYASNTNYDNSWSYEGSTASGQQDQWRAGAELRAGYLFEQGGWMFKPRLGLGMTHFGGSSYTETGTATAFEINTLSETFAYVRPALEVAGSFLTPGGMEIRPNAVFSVTQFFGDTSFDATARLAGSSASSAPFDWQTEIDTTQFDVSAGLAVLSENGASFDISAFGHMTENQRGIGGKMRLSIPF
ncbi:autotransporter outer membrane beta-barrel domain-containing protein [Labrenzia sp. CE80]|uniref:autotransporter outer membrane beta-barrel domain-containing protein n=1 Tax=Labrenzia sp. CE80 TaxID=1788986 RepID=UPI00129A6C13|nr:autotransporter outer membrane beta-barrel domain-containing protein [Labrenzia sp. CE80]